MLDLQTNGSVITEPEGNAARERDKYNSSAFSQSATLGTTTGKAFAQQQPIHDQSVKSQPSFDSRPKKDVWDKIAAIAPIVSGFLISSIIIGRARWISNSTGMSLSRRLLRCVLTP